MRFLRAHPAAVRRAALAAVLLVAFVLRIWNLNWDAGTHQHPDERYWSIITSEVSAPGVGNYFDSASSSLNPYNLEGRDTWVYGTLPLFSTKAAASFLADGPFPAGAIVSTAEAVGIDLRTDGVDSFDAGYNANLVGRLLSALIDTATVALVYLIGRDLFDRRVGMVAAVLLAFAPLHIQYAHFYGAEAWVTFFATAAVWAALRLARGDLRLRVAGGTGVLLGLAAASKLIGLAALAVPATAILVAVGPSIAAWARGLWGRARPVAVARPGAATAVGLLGAVAFVGVALTVPLLLALALGLAVAAIVAISLFVIAPAEAARPGPARLFDHAEDPPEVEVARGRARPPWQVAIWGAFAGIVVLVATAVTYRIFQPYTFDGLWSIDPRFSRDLDYLEGVNSGGNVPWVVQWIGRTPLFFPLRSAFWWGMGPALALAVVAGTAKAVLDIVRKQRWILLVPLSFVAVMLGLVSQQFNPLIRYLLPAYPVAIVLGGFGVISLWDAGARLRLPVGGRAGSIAVRAVAASLVVLTAFWGLAFVNGVYNSDHPRIEASVWMAENLPADAVLSHQIWDDALPLGVPGTEGTEFTTVALDPFQPDKAVDQNSGTTKVEQFVSGLAQVDYVVEASNRVYDSVPRFPARYPSTNAYYRALFDGSLGFVPVAQFRNSPNLFGITISDHDAEETFTVYDHPTVTIWEKTDNFTPERATAILNPAKATVAPDLPPSEASTNALLLRPEQQAASSSGGTFTDAFGTGGDGPTTWIAWFIWLQVAALAVLPWTVSLCARLPDRGYGLSKVIGILSVGLGAWLTVSWDLAAYSRSLIWVWFGAIGALGVVLWVRHRARMAALLRSHRTSWMVTELVFLAVFGLTLWMRSANPDLWEAYLGGEKPMELAYLTAIGRAGDLPAPDPWFAGGFMNYYYFGWYLLSLPMRALRILPEVAFNLGVATYAALTAATAFSIVHNLVAISRSRWKRPSRQRYEGGVVDDDPRTSVAVWSGLLGVVLLIGIGNLDAIRLHYNRLEAVNTWDTGSGIPVVGHVITFAGGTWAWITGTPLARFDFFQPSRVNRGNIDITEFPYFTYLFGDLHPHLMGMAFIGLTVGLVLTYLLASRYGDRWHALAGAVALGVATGVVRLVNTWDLPSVAILAGAAIVIGRLLTPVRADDLDPQRRGLSAVVAVVCITAGASAAGGPGGGVLMLMGLVGVVALLALVAPWRWRRRLLGIVGHGSLMVATHVVVFWPFLRSTETGDTGIRSAVDSTPVVGFVEHWGVFVVIAAAMAMALVIDGRHRRRGGAPNPGPLPDVVWASARWKGVWIGLSAVAIVAAAVLSTAVTAISVAGVIVFVSLLLVELRREQHDMGRIVTLGLFALAFGIAGGVDVVTVQNDVGRMNTVFKFWLQAWQYFALAAGFAVWQVGRVLTERPVVAPAVEPRSARERWERRAVAEAGPVEPRTSRWRVNVWGSLVAILVLAGLMYPLLGTRTRLETRFAQLPATLDGLAYLEADPSVVRLDESQVEVRTWIGDDLALIEWLRSNVEGTPTLVEWVGPLYGWNARMSIHTGIPAVLGWDWHQKQQRWPFQWMVDERVEAVRNFYTVANESEITTFLQTYEVAYVIVGTQELAFASPDVLARMAAHPALEPVFTSGELVIYRVLPDALWPGVDLAAIDLLAFSD